MSADVRYAPGDRVYVRFYSTRDVAYGVVLTPPPFDHGMNLQRWTYVEWVTMPAEVRHLFASPGWMEQKYFNPVPPDDLEAAVLFAAAPAH